MMMSEVETMETGSSGEGGGGGGVLLNEQVNYSNLNGGLNVDVGGIDYLTMSASIGGDGGSGDSFQPLETICELNNSSMPYLYSTDLSLDSGNGGNLEGTSVGGDGGGEQGSSSQNFEASLITLNDISNSYHGNPLASLGALEGWTNGGIEDYNWINNGENYEIPLNTPQSLSTCSTSLYNFYEEDEKECQKDLDEILRTQSFGGDDGGMFFPPTPAATSLEYAVKSKPVQCQVPDKEEDNDDDEEEDGDDDGGDGGDQEGNSEEEEETPKTEETSKGKGKKERQIRQERCSECEIDFRLPCLYERHMEKVHSEKFPYSCEHVGCSKKFAKYHQRRQHHYIHDPKRFEGKGAWECGLCDKVYYVRCSLYQHWKTNHADVKPEERKQLIAKAREQKLKNGGSGGGGIRKKTETDPEEGPGLTQIFREMKKTQISEGKKKRRSSSSSCVKINEGIEEEVVSPALVSAPAPSVVVGEAKAGYHPCGVCGKIFDIPWNLRMHMMLHTGEKPIRCPKCPERFRLKQTLTNHLMRRHRSREERRNVLKMYKCRVCGRDDFEMWQDAYGHRIKRHKEVEYEREKEKPFGCGICLKPYFLREDAIICAVLGHEGGVAGGGGKGRRNKERQEEIRRRGFEVEGIGFERPLYFDLTEWGPSEMEQDWVARRMLEVMGKGGRDMRQICTLCGVECSNRGNFKRHLNSVHVSEEMARKEKEEEEVTEEEEPPKKKVKEEVGEETKEEKEGNSVFKCRFCDKEFGKKRALHFHEVRGHINPKKNSREEEKEVTKGKKGKRGVGKEKKVVEVVGEKEVSKGKKGKRGVGKEKKVVEVVAEEDDTTNGSDLFTEVVSKRRSRGREKARKGGEEKMEVMLSSVNLNDKLAVANVLNFKSLTVVVRDLSREDILGMNEGKIGNLSALDGKISSRRRDRREERPEERSEETEDGGRRERRRGRPRKHVQKKERGEKNKRGSGRTSQREYKTGRGTGRRGRPPKECRNLFGNVPPEEIIRIVMEERAKLVAAGRWKALSGESDKEEEEEGEDNGNVEGEEDDGMAAVNEVVEEEDDSSEGVEVAAQREEEQEGVDDEEEGDEVDDDMEEMIQEELEEMMEEAQLDDWLADVGVRNPNVAEAEGEDSVQFLGEFSGSGGEDSDEEQEGIQQEQYSSSSSPEESECDTEGEEENDEEDVEEEEVIGEDENANLEAIVPMHHDDEEENEVNNYEEDPLLLDDFSPPPTPRSPPPRRYPPRPVPQQEEEEEDEEVDVECEDDDEDEVEEEAEGTVSSTTKGYQIDGQAFSSDVEDTNSSAVQSEREGEGMEEGTSGSNESEETLPLRNIPGINPNLLRGLPKVVLRRIEQDHTLNVNLALIRNNEDSG